MINYFELVDKFNSMFQDKPGQVTIDKEAINLRIRLLKEEISELKEAALLNDKIEVLDALCDILYIFAGTVNVIGFTQDEFNTAFEEVHKTNMAKFLTTKEAAEQTVKAYVDSGTECHYIEKNGLFAVIRHDGKLIKPIGWQKPMLR